MRRELRLLLDDIHSASTDILYFTAGKDEAAYLGDLMMRRAVERSFEIIGEACRQCQLHYPGALASISSVDRIIGFRNELAHQYSVIEDDVVWSIVRLYLPLLKTEVQQLIAGLSSTLQ